VAVGAIADAAEAGRSVKGWTKGNQVLEEDLFESRGRGLVVSVQQGHVIRGEPAQGAFPEINCRTTHPVGEPALSSGRKASGVSDSRTERRSGAIRKGSLNGFRTVQHHGRSEQ
jgi:hypothetical protein